MSICQQVSNITLQIYNINYISKQPWVNCKAKEKDKNNTQNKTKVQVIKYGRVVYWFMYQEKKYGSVVYGPQLASIKKSFSALDFSKE